jgi:hypothetical protein
LKRKYFFAALRQKRLERKARFPALCSKAPEMRPKKADKSFYALVPHKNIDKLL